MHTTRLPHPTTTTTHSATMQTILHTTISHTSSRFSTRNSPRHSSRKSATTDINRTQTTVQPLTQPSMKLTTTNACTTQPPHQPNKPRILPCRHILNYVPIRKLAHRCADRVRASSRQANRASCSRQSILVEREVVILHILR